MSSDDAWVVRARNVGKAYQIYDTPRARLKQFLLPRMQRVAGMAPKRYYRSFHALNDTSFDVGRGETVGIIGRNGSGKSTLLQLVCGTLTPTHGQVRTRGRVAALLELGSGFNPEFTGRENVYLNAAIHGLSRRDVDERFEAIERFADIGDFIDQPTKAYSSGMTVRLAFATAIHLDPDLLVVDEALAVGDVGFQQKCLNRIRQMQREGTSILLVTHSTNTLVEYCDRGILLQRGQLVLDGPCRDVVKVYADSLVRDEGGASDLEIPANVEAPAPTPDQAPLVSSTELTGEGAPIAIESVALLDANEQRVGGVERGAAVAVRVRVRVREAIAQPCFGIQLSSPDGIALWSVSTQSFETPVAPLAPGLHEFTWRLRANFGAARYVIALGVGQLVDGDYRRCHRVDYAGHFDVLPMAHAGSGWLAPDVMFDAPVAASEVA